MLGSLLGIAIVSGAMQAQIWQAPATIVVDVPADAAVLVDGAPTSSTGQRRLFVSPPLEGGWVYDYTLTLNWHGKSIVRKIAVRPGSVTALAFAPTDFSGETIGAPAKRKEGTTVKSALPDRPGFILKQEEGRWWVFRAGSKDLKELEKHGFPEKHVSRINVQPWKVTLKAPDWETLVGYVTTHEGFDTFLEDGRLWVFRKGAKEYAEYKKHGELAKHVTRINAGPLGLTLKAPDAATIEAYQKARGE
ncbi:MAG: TIGR03000 domain-containing protein [Gemmataceae bacterium]